MTEAPVICWQGDLEHYSCTAWNRLAATVNFGSDGLWHARVWTPDMAVTFDTEECEVRPATGNAARELCELVMRAWVAGVRYRDA